MLSRIVLCRAAPLARRELARGVGVTLSATTLLHDAYSSISAKEGVAFPDRNRYMGYASRVMRGRHLQPLVAPSRAADGLPAAPGPKVPGIFGPSADEKSFS
jgi:hypothetical protein